MRIKLSLRSKFYILILPAAIVLITTMVLLMLPHAEIYTNVSQINQGLAEVLAAESFARHYERQLRECAAFIATGSADHERLFEQARQNANVDLAKWVAAEGAHENEPVAENKEELEKLKSTKRAYEEVTRACDWAIALARSGQNVVAMNYMEDASDGSAGMVLQKNLDEHLPEEEEQLNRYLDNLDGAIRSLSVMRLMGLQSTVDSMHEHVLSSVLTEQFARYYNEEIKEALAFIVTGDPTDEQAVEEAKQNALEVLDSWSEQVSLLGQDMGRGKSTALLDRIETQYKDINKALLDSAGQARAGDNASALTNVEEETGPTQQSTLTSAINKEVEAQKRSLTEDADYISSSSRNVGWGVGIVGTLLLLVAIGGTLLVSRMVLVPVVQLKDAARKFGKSGADVEVPVKAHDELGELSESFNEMAAARRAAEDELRNARDELEDRVEERTKELEKLNAELLGINTELNDFAYIVSHDLKAPLRGIGSLASWLATDYDDVLDEQGRMQLNLLLDRAKRMESLIESVLAYSRVGRVRESMEVVESSELVSVAIEMIGPPSNVSITVLGRLPKIKCERTRMQQVFQNIIGNAVKFMDKPIGIVTVSCRDAGSLWEFAVADNGPGIDERYYDQIFKIFQTLGPTDDKESTGIGLTLVKKIVEMHGGTVWVESEIDKGSTFFFTVPKS